MAEIEIKKALYQVCLNSVENRAQKIKQTIQDLDESLFEQAKSGGDDEYDNSRAMMQIDRENATKQLKEVLQLKELLNRMDVAIFKDYARLGSLVKTNKATYFISLSIGAVVINEVTYVCVAFSSPMGQILKGKQKGDQFTFNELQYTVLSIH